MMPSSNLFLKAHISFACFVVRIYDVAGGGRQRSEGAQLNKQRTTLAKNMLQRQLQLQQRTGQPLAGVGSSGIFGGISSATTRAHHLRQHSDSQACFDPEVLDL